MPGRPVRLFRCEPTPNRWGQPADIKYLATILPESKHTGCAYSAKTDQYYCALRVPTQRGEQ